MQQQVHAAGVQGMCALRKREEKEASRNQDQVGL